MVRIASPTSATCALCLLLVVTPASQAQETSERSISNRPTPAATPEKAAAKNKKLTAAERVRADQQRALATSLLISLSNDAGSFSDQKLRARTLARIADGLWQADPDQSRALFLKGLGCCRRRR